MATKTKKADYRIRIKDSLNHLSYLVRTRGSLDYYNSAEVPLALSNLIWENAAEARFRLVDAANSDEAVSILKELTGAKVLVQDITPED